MGLENFIPEVWSARLAYNFDKALVYAGLANRDYEGEISQFGDTVRISAIGPVTVGSYTKDTDINDPQALTSAQTTLLIDQAKYFNFQIDDVDAAQQKPKVMDAAMQRAAYSVADAVDQYVASMNSQAEAISDLGTTSTPKVPATSDIYEYFVLMGQILDERNIRSEGRWAVVPPWVYSLMLKDKTYFIRATTPGDTVVQRGLVGEYAGFTIYKSNNVANTSGAKYKIMAGVQEAISYAGQITKIEAYRPEKRFANAVKGLYVYGAKVVHPQALVVATFSKS